MEHFYELKYLKYKKKYKQLLKQEGGTIILWINDEEYNFENSDPPGTYPMSNEELSFIYGKQGVELKVSSAHDKLNYNKTEQQFLHNLIKLTIANLKVFEFSNLGHSLYNHRSRLNTKDFYNSPYFKEIMHELILDDTNYNRLYKDLTTFIDTVKDDVEGRQVSRRLSRQEQEKKRKFNAKLIEGAENMYVLLKIYNDSIKKHMETYKLTWDKIYHMSLHEQLGYIDAVKKNMLSDGYSPDNRQEMDRFFWKQIEIMNKNHILTLNFDKIVSDIITILNLKNGANKRDLVHEVTRLIPITFPPHITSNTNLNILIKNIIYKKVGEQLNFDVTAFLSMQDTDVVIEKEVKAPIKERLIAYYKSRTDLIEPIINDQEEKLRRNKGRIDRINDKDKKKINDNTTLSVEEKADKIKLKEDLVKEAKKEQKLINTILREKRLELESLIGERDEYLNMINAYETHIKEAEEIIRVSEETKKRFKVYETQWGVEDAKIKKNKQKIEEINEELEGRLSFIN